MHSIMIHQAIPLDLSHFLAFYSIDLIPEVTPMKKEPRSARSRLESETTEGDMEWVEGRSTIQRIDDFS